MREILEQHRHLTGEDGEGCVLVEYDVNLVPHVQYSHEGEGSNGEGLSSVPCYMPYSTSGIT